ncbi:hypothetical protein C2S51_018044 [Perilla frutescens var. frutescens]|nr:hypothetical protein C2S51_018044 [Perilla frutescens var. frutescens]
MLNGTDQLDCFVGTLEHECPETACLYTCVKKMALHALHNAVSQLEDLIPPVEAAEAESCSVTMPSDLKLSQPTNRRS